MDELESLKLDQAILVILRDEGISSIPDLLSRAIDGSLDRIPRIGAKRASEIREALRGRFQEKDPFLPLYLYAGFVATTLSVVLAIWGFGKEVLQPGQYFILIAVFPLFSGIAAGCFCGGMIATVKNHNRWAGLAVAAGGAFAVWLITFMYLPRLLPAVQ